MNDYVPQIARRSLPLLAIAAAMRPAAADTIDLSLACHTAFASALRSRRPGLCACSYSHGLDCSLVHFIVMFGIVLFILVHVGLTLIVPRTLLAMVVGRATEPRHIVTSEDAR